MWVDALERFTKQKIITRRLLKKQKVYSPRILKETKSIFPTSLL